MVFSKRNEMVAVSKTDEEWKNQLTPEQYEVCRRKGTEIPYSGEYYNSKEKGMYRCVCCVCSGLSL